MFPGGAAATAPTTKYAEPVQSKEYHYNYHENETINTIATITTQINNLYEILNSITQRIDAVSETAATAAAIANTTISEIQTIKDIIPPPPPPQPSPPMSTEPPLLQTAPIVSNGETLSNKYSITANTLFLEAAQQNNFFIKLEKEEDMINRLVITNIPAPAPASAPTRHYKFKIYIKRTPYRPAVSYINIEQLEIQTADNTEYIVPLNKSGSGAGATSSICIKPSVNCSFIIQEFDIFCTATDTAPEICAFQTISER